MIITTLPSAGSLTLNGIAVTAGQSVSAADIAAGCWCSLRRPMPTVTPMPASPSRCRTTAGTANGGVDTDQSPNTITIDVTPVNDAPVAVDDSGSGNEDSTITGTVATNDSDVDDGASLSYAPNNVPAGFAMLGDGSWSLDASNAAYQHIAQGAYEDVVVTYTVTDEHGATGTASLTIRVNGVNDAPVAVDDSGSGNEDSTITGTVATNDSDVDDGASLSYAPNNVPAGFAMLGDGSWSLDASNAAYQHIAQGAYEDVVVTYTVTDEHRRDRHGEPDHPGQWRQRRSGGGRRQRLGQRGLDDHRHGGDQRQRRR